MPEQQALITDLFERIAIYDLKAKQAVTGRLPDGRWSTRLTIEAGKFYANGKGQETPTKLSETIEVGVFADRSGRGAFDRADVLLMQRRAVRAGTQVIEIVSRQKPRFAGIDPYNFYIDKNSDDNLVAVN